MVKRTLKGGSLMEKIGSWAFLAGLVLAILFGFISGATWTIPVLVVLGLIVGFLNISEKEVTSFLIAAIALMAAGAANLTVIPQLGTYLADILANITVFVAPAALIVAIKAIYGMAKD